MAAFLEQIQVELINRTYRPAKLKTVQIEKPGKPGQFRTLGIPTVRDRTVMTAAAMVRKEANRGADWVLTADVQDALGNLDHDA